MESSISDTIHRQDDDEFVPVFYPQYLSNFSKGVDMTNSHTNNLSIKLEVAERDLVKTDWITGLNLIYEHCLILKLELVHFV